MTERRLASELWLASLEGAPPERSSDRSLEIAAPRTSSITVEAIAVRLRRSANHRATMRHATSLVWQVPHHASSPLAYRTVQIGGLNGLLKLRLLRELHILQLHILHRCHVRVRSFPLSRCGLGLVLHDAFDVSESPGRRYVTGPASSNYGPGPGALYCEN